MYKLPNGKTVYPEDIECVHDPVNGKGGIFIGNLEAAQNIQTLKSTLYIIKNMESKQFSQQPKEFSLNILNVKFPSNSTFLEKITKDLI